MPRARRCPCTKTLLRWGSALQRKVGLQCLRCRIAGEYVCVTGKCETPLNEGRKGISCLRVSSTQRAGGMACTATKTGSGVGGNPTTTGPPSEAVRRSLCKSLFPSSAQGPSRFFRTRASPHRVSCGSGSRFCSVGRGGDSRLRVCISYLLWTARRRPSCPICAGVLQDQRGAATGRHLGGSNRTRPPARIELVVYLRPRQSSGRSVNVHSTRANSVAYADLS